MLRPAIAGALALVVLLALSSSSPQAQLTTVGAGGAGGGGVPATPCAAGQLDFSDAAGCNTTQYMVILK